MEQVFVLNKERNVTLTAMVQPLSPELGYITKRPAVLVIPGGAYQMCSDREAEPIAYQFLQAGFDAFVLRYSVKEHSTWPNPLLDYEQAMEFIESHADEWHVATDKIAVVGFSAGGHLAVMAASVGKHRPAAAVLGYPALENRFWQNIDSGIPDAIEKVNETTCPCFVFSTYNDQVVPIENSVDLMSALVRFGVPFESHIYSYGPHGLSNCDSSVSYAGFFDRPFTPRAKNWVADSVAWLREVMGDFGGGKFTEPNVQNRK